MTHSEADRAIAALFSKELGRRARHQLQEHLNGCDACRAQYDRAALAYRKVRHRPDAMSPEELALFEAPIPRPPLWLRWPVWAGGLSVAAAAAAALLLLSKRGHDEFSPRGGPTVVATPSLRAFCARGSGAERTMAEASTSACRDGDRVLFSVHAAGRGYLALAIMEDTGPPEILVAGAPGRIDPATAEGPLPVSAAWHSTARAIAMFAGSALDPLRAEECARGDCPAGVDRVVVEFSKSRGTP